MFIGTLGFLYGILLSGLFALPVIQQVIPLNDTTYVNQLLLESEIDINHGNFPSAREKIRRAKEISDSLDYEFGQTLSIVRLGDALLNQHKNDSAISIINEAIEEFPESRHLIDFYNFLATAHHYKNDHLTAIEYYNKALEQVPNLPEDEQARTTAGIRQNMANTYMGMGNKNKSFENYLAAVRFSEMTRDTIFWVTTLNNIGNAYNQIKSFDNAEFYLEKARRIAQLKNLKTELYRITLNLANTRSAQEQYEQAKELYSYALAIEKEIRPNSPPVIILHNLGWLNRSMGNYKTAEDLYNESLNYSLEHDITVGVYHNNRGLGQLYYDMGRYEESLLYLNRAYQIANEFQNTPFLQETRELLYKSYEGAKQYENAYHILAQFKATADSLFTIEKEQALATLENQLALDRQSEINQLLQEKQVQQERKLQFQLILIVAAILVIVLILIILFLMKKREKEKEEVTNHLQQQKIELEEANQAKNKLFSIVAHDLRSPLTALQGILYLIKNKVLSNEQLQEMTQELEVSVQQNIDTMEDLLAWANEQLSGVKMDLQIVDLCEITDSVLNKQSYVASKKGIELINRVPEDSKVHVDKNALKLVLRNILSNSIKFTPANGKITISAKVSAQNIHLEVADTGIGIPKKDANKVFDNKPWTRKGTNNEKGTGYGMKLSKEFIEKMHGSINFESEEGKGTTFFIDLPKK